MHQFLHGTISFVDRGIGIGSGSDVGIGDCNSPERFASNFAGALSRWPFGIEKIVVCVGVTMRPAVHRDGEDIASRIESARRQNSSEWIANVPLESLESSGKQVAAPGAVLVAFRKPREARRTLHANHDWLIGRFRRAELAYILSEFETEFMMIHAWRRDLADT